jgi:hypothetical protein
LRRASRYIWCRPDETQPRTLDNPPLADSARIPRQRPHSLFANAGVVPRLLAPRNFWIGTLGTAEMPRFSRLDPNRILLGRLSSVCFEVQPRSGNVRSPNDPESGRRPAQVRPSRCLTSSGKNNLLLRLWTLRARSDRSKWRVTAPFWTATSPPRLRAWGQRAGPSGEPARKEQCPCELDAVDDADLRPSGQRSPPVRPSAARRRAIAVPVPPSFAPVTTATLSHRAPGQLRLQPALSH